MADRADDLVLNVARDAFPVDHLRLRALPDAVELVGAVNQQRHGLVRQGGDGLVEREIVFARDGADQFELAPVADAPQRGDAAVGDGLPGIRDDGVQADVRHGAEALAVRAVAFRGIEGEGVRGRLLQGDAVLRVHQVLGIMVQRTRLMVEHRQRAFAQPQGGSDRSAYARLVPLAGLELVHDELDEVPFVAVHGLDLVQVADLPVDADLQIALLAERVEQFAVVALAAAHQRREQHALASVELLQDQVHDLRVGVAHHLLARDGRIGG